MHCFLPSFVDERGNNIIQHPHHRVKVIAQKVKHGMDPNELTRLFSKCLLFLFDLLATHSTTPLNGLKPAGLSGYYLLCFKEISNLYFSAEIQVIARVLMKQANNLCFWHNVKEVAFVKCICLIQALFCNFQHQLFQLVVSSRSPWPLIRTEYRLHPGEQVTPVILVQVRDIKLFIFLISIRVSWVWLVLARHPRLPVGSLKHATPPPP